MPTVYAVIVKWDKSSLCKKAAALSVQVACLAEFCGEQQKDGDGYSR